MHSVATVPDVRVPILPTTRPAPYPAAREGYSNTAPPLAHLARNARPVHALSTTFATVAAGISVRGRRNRFARPRGRGRTVPFPMGMNLAGVADWSTRSSSSTPSRSRGLGPARRKAPSSARAATWRSNDRGWVKKLADTQFAEALIHMDIGNHYPGGKYVCLFDGEGELEFSNAAQGRSERQEQVRRDGGSRSRIHRRPRCARPTRRTRSRTFDW